MGQGEAVDLEKAASVLATAAVESAFQILEEGRPQDRISLITKLVGPMLKELRDSDDGSDAQRALFERLFAEVRQSGVSDSPGAATQDSDEGLPRDEPGAQLGPEEVP